MSEKVALSGKDSFLTCSEDMFEGFIRERLNTSTEDNFEEEMDTEHPIVSEVIVGEESADSTVEGKLISVENKERADENGDSYSDNTSSKQLAKNSKTFIVSREKLNLDRKISGNSQMNKPKSVNVVKKLPAISPKHENGPTMLSPTKPSSGVFLVKSADSGRKLNPNELILKNGKKLVLVSQKKANGDESRIRSEGESSPERANSISPISVTYTNHQKKMLFKKPVNVLAGVDRKTPLDVSGISSLVAGSYNGHVSKKVEVSVGASSSVNFNVKPEPRKSMLDVPDEHELESALNVRVTPLPETHAFKKPIQLSGRKTIVNGKPISLDSATRKKLLTMMNSSDDKIIYVENNAIRLKPISEHSVKCVVERSNENIKELSTKNAESEIQRIVLQGDYQQTDDTDEERLQNSNQQHSPSYPSSKRISEVATNMSETDCDRSDDVRFDFEKELAQMYLQQLTDRAIPVFEPKPPQPFATHLLGCAECHDKFTQQSSLDFHRSRRSILISYMCSVCNRRLSFLNRCALMRHLRGHQRKLCTIDMASVSIQPIPTNLMKLANTYDQSPPNTQHQINAKKVLVTVKKPPSATQTNSVSTDSVTKEVQVRKVRLDGSGKLVELENVRVRDNAVEDRVVPVAKERVVPVNDLPNVDVSNAINSSKRVVESNKINTSTLQTTAPKIGNGSKVVKLKADRRVKSCPECKVNLGGEKTLQDHLLNTNRPCNPFLQCNDCHLILPTRCSLRMHLRMHIPLKPYRCPECGIEFQIYERFMLHLKFECCHLAKVIRFTCTLCNVREPSLNMLREHILECHTRRIYKCNNCSMAFLNKKLILRHQNEVHNNTRCSFTLFSQCKFCPEKMIPHKRFSNHVAKHITDENFKLYMYECYQCKKCFLQKKDLTEHLKACDSNEIEKTNGDSDTVPRASDVRERNYVEVGNDVLPKNSVVEIAEESEEEVEMIVPESRVSRAGEEDEVSLRDPLSLEGFQVEEQPVSEPVLELCVLCKKQRVVIEPGEIVAQQSLCCRECVRPCGETDLQPRQTMTTRRKTRTQTIYRCKLCNYLSVVDFDVLLRHFRRMHKEVGDGNVKHYVAIETKNVFHSVRSKTVSTAESIKDKYLKKRKVNNDDSVQVKEEPMDVDEDDCEDDSIVRMAKKRSSPKAKPPTTSGLKTQFDRGLVMKASQSADSNLKCVKCSFMTDSLPSLRSHVTQHRTDRSALQCLECGECFVVLPSLEKHLAIRHHILDVDRYIADNPSCVPPTDADANNTLECSVCLSSFESRQELDKHTRIHGMAFLKQARTKS